MFEVWAADRGTATQHAGQRRAHTSLQTFYFTLPTREATLREAVSNVVSGAEGGLDFQHVHTSVRTNVSL